MNKRVKETMMTWLVVVGFFLMIGLAGTWEHTYTREDCVVVAVQGDVVVAEDRCGQRATRSHSSCTQHSHMATLKMMRLEITRCRDNLHLSLRAAVTGARTMVARLICSVGSLAQKTFANFVHFAYCIFSRMWYTIIRGREEPRIQVQCLGYLLGSGLRKVAKELPRNNKKSIDKISVAWYNKDTKRER